MLNDIQSLNCSYLVQYKSIYLMKDYIYYILPKFEISLQTVVNIIFSGSNYDCNILNLIEYLCNSAKELHSLGIINGNVKPSNIFIEYNDGEINYKISDYCYNQKYLKYDLRVSECNIQYFSPEQLENKELNEKVDIWSIGSIIYEIINGYCAFGNENLYVKMFNIMNCRFLQSKGQFQDKYDKEIFSLIFIKDINERIDVDSLLSKIRGIYY